MQSFSTMAKKLNRSAVYLNGLQKRFELPVFEGASYSEAYLSFLRTIVFLRTLNISEEALRDLWHIEKKLLQFLHIDSTGSPTWYLDSCGRTTERDHRLLLSNYNLGVAVPSNELQLGLNFSDKPPELFAGKEMGEDGLRVLNKYIKLYSAIRCEVLAELPRVRETLAWASTFRVLT